MVGRVHRWLLQIRYYSAKPERSIWARARDVVLILSPLLALPVGLSSSMMSRQTTVVAHVTGRVVQNEKGETQAVVGASLPVDSPSPPLWLNTLSLRAVRHHYGWPWVCWQREAALEVRSAMLPTKEYVPLASSKVDDGFRDMIKQSLEVQAPALHRRTDAGALRWHPLQLLMTIAIWCVLLYVLGLLALLPTRVLLGLRRGRKIRRQRDYVRRGYCAGCGYDLRGLEFQCRCPECGRFAY